MNRKYLLFLALIPAILTVSLYDSLTLNEEINPSTSMGIGTGHFEVTVKDSMGAVTAYRQSDNDIVNSGENCVAKMMFRHPTNAGNTVCTGATNAAWNYLCLDESAAVTPAKVEIGDIPEDADLSTCSQATITWNQNSTGTSTAASKVTLRLSHTFTNQAGGVGSETILGVGVANETALATRSFLSFANFTGVPVADGSTITVNYDYEVGGGTVP